MIKIEKKKLIAAIMKATADMKESRSTGNLKSHQDAADNKNETVH